MEQGNRSQRKIEKSSTKHKSIIETSGNTGKERVSKIPASKIPARQRLSVIASEENDPSDLTGSTMNICNKFSEYLNHLLYVLADERNSCECKVEADNRIIAIYTITVSGAG